MGFIKLCVRVLRRPRVAATVIVVRPAVRSVRRIIAPTLFCTVVVPPSFEPPAPLQPATPPAVVERPTPLTYALPAGPLLPPNDVWLTTAALPPSGPTQHVPEPATALLLVSGLGALVLLRKPL